MGEPAGGVERCRLRVNGRVQGVGFRAWTAWRAGELGLAGWVRNRGDGAVELEAEGDPANLARFREELRHGPPLSHVTGIEWLESSRESLPRPFAVRY